MGRHGRKLSCFVRGAVLLLFVSKVDVAKMRERKPVRIKGRVRQRINKIDTKAYREF